MRARCDSSVSLSERIAHHALETPAAPALISAEGHLNYAALASRMRRLISLLAELGVVAGERVAVCADRRVGGVIALAAVQALGAAYVPIDGTLPAERLSFILADAGVNVLLACPSMVGRLPTAGRKLVLLDDVLSDDWLAEYSCDDRGPAAGSGQSTACVIYTSGSTGAPKGVKVSRDNIAHYVTAMCERHDFTACRQFAINSAFHTDLGNTTLYIGLWRGACLHLMDGAMMLDGRAVSDYVRAREIDVIKITPGHFAALCDGAAHPPPVPRTLLIFGGEVLRKELLLQIRDYCEAQGCRIVNHYGPTEATIGCLTCEPHLQQSQAKVPLGLPLPGVRARIMLEDRAVSRGSWGELWIGGPGVCLGYLNREDLSAQHFVTRATSNGGVERYYRTGDRVRIDPDGQILFGGRLDDQVKIRGFRIELAEVDGHLRAMPGVTGAVTLPHHEGQSLISYVTPADVRPTELLERLREHLPQYMVPEAVIPLTAFPLLGNGKVDRCALEPLMDLIDNLRAVVHAPVPAGNVVELAL
jgi:amino acid adenylation domain-containing protein